MCLAAEKDDQGGPVFTVEDLPPRGSPDLTVSRPEIYYGTDMTNYQIVPTRLKEFDYPQGDQNAYTNYTGHGGILLDSFWKKAVLAWHQFDMSIVLSSYLSPQSRIQLWRAVQQSVARLAPFLKLDRDPYLLETSVPGIYACGDVRFSEVKRVAAAVGEGSMAIKFVHQYLKEL